MTTEPTAPARRRPSPCDVCEVDAWVWSDRLPGWFCVNCDRSEEQAIEERDEERDREYERSIEELDEWDGAWLDPGDDDSVRFAAGDRRRGYRRDPRERLGLTEAVDEDNLADYRAWRIRIEPHQTGDVFAVRRAQAASVRCHPIIASGTYVLDHLRERVALPEPGPPRVFAYEDDDTPSDYACATCGTRGVRLWRGYQEVLTQLECTACCTARTRRAYDGDAVELGWSVAAVPDEQGLGYWGLGGFPPEALAWWRALPIERSTP